MTTSFILVNEEILLPFARFAKCECGSLQVLARRARPQQIRRGLVDLMNRGEMLEGGSAAAPPPPGPMCAAFVTPQEYDSNSTSSL
jgi:hypothetical protein